MRHFRRTAGIWPDPETVTGGRLVPVEPDLQAKLAASETPKKVHLQLN